MRWMMVVTAAALAQCAPSVQPYEGSACLYESTPSDAGPVRLVVRQFDTPRDCTAYRGLCNASEPRCSGCCTYCPE